VHGDLPYRDFLFLHPPGITLLMSPVAGVAGIFGTPAALAAARIVTVLVSAANASLVALVVRHRGPVAMLTAGLLFALYPAAINATHTLLLEPYVALFCLIGVNVLFKAGRMAPGRQVLYAGLALGFACSLKLWAAPVVVAAMIVAAVNSRKALAALSAGVAVGFGVVCMPFFLSAPGAFISNVFLVQFKRSDASSSVLLKLRALTGADGIESIHVPTFVVVAISAIFVACVLFRVVRDRRDFVPCDWCVIAAFVATTLACFATSQFYAHYSYLPFVWIATTAALLVPRALPRGVPRTAVLFLLAALCVVALDQNARHARALLTGSFTVVGVVDEVVPPGGCLLVDVTTFSIVADRFTSADPGCPLMIDPFGEWVTHTQPHRPYVGVYPQSFVADFANKLNSSEFVAFAAPYSTYVPWTPELGRWFAANFDEIRHTNEVVVYAHRQHTPPPKQFPSMMEGTADQLVARGIESEKSGDIASAFDYYQAAMARDPGNKYAHFDAGHVDQMRGQADRAESEYKTALQSDPNFVAALYNLAVLTADADPAAAMDLYRSVLTQQPDDPAANFNLGVLLCRTGDASGKDLIRKAISLKPELGQDVPPDISLG
jgi:hypothetical protein